VVGLNSDQLDGNDASQFATQAELAALQARVEALEATLAAVSYDDTAKLLKVTGATCTSSTAPATPTAQLTGSAT
jgi:hypothetical protein